MTEKPDLSAFQADERAREYSVRFDVRGEIYMTIQADSLEAAKAQAEAMVQDDGFGSDLDEVTNADVVSVYKSPPLFFVTRDGRAMKVSRLEVDDIPRKPDENGW